MCQVQAFSPSTTIDIISLQRVALLEWVRGFGFCERERHGVAFVSHVTEAGNCTAVYAAAIVIGKYLHPTIAQEVRVANTEGRRTFLEGLMPTVEWL